jgi:hypothetical protein
MKNADRYFENGLCKHKKYKELIYQIALLARPAGWVTPSPLLYFCAFVLRGYMTKHGRAEPRSFPCGPLVEMVKGGIPSTMPP